VQGEWAAQSLLHGDSVERAW